MPIPLFDYEAVARRIFISFSLSTQKDRQLFWRPHR